MEPDDLTWALEERARAGEHDAALGFHRLAGGDSYETTWVRLESKDGTIALHIGEDVYLVIEHDFVIQVARLALLSE